jgi:S1-C subfamily serine protease
VLEGVPPENPVEKAGPLRGDQFIASEGKEVTRVKDIQKAIDQKSWGKDIAFTMLRGGMKEEMTAAIPASGG